MSTRNTLKLVTDEDGQVRWHLYEDVGEEEGFIWLAFPATSLRDHGINRSGDGPLLRIPNHVWEELTK